MTALRRLLVNRRGLAAWLCALALALRLVVPTGYMPVVRDHALTIAFCPDAAPMPAMPMPTMAGMEHSGDAGHDHDDGGAHAPCPFAAATAPALGGADPVAWSAPPARAEPSRPPPPVRSERTRRDRLRPPGRGPPASA